MNNNDLLKTIDLNHLAIFTKIAESKNLTEAAKMIGQEKTRLSRILSDLESALNVELVYRTTRQFQLTESGRRLYEICKEPLSSIQAGTSDFLSNDELHGHIRLTGAHGVFTKFITPVLEHFRQLHPRVTFEIVFAQQRLNLVREGIDLAVRMGAMQDSSLRMLKVGNIATVFAVSPKHLKDLAPLTTIEELTERRFVMLESLNDKPLTFINGEQKKELKLQGTVVANGPDVLLEMVLRGMGFGLLPELLCREHFATGELVPIFPEWKTEPTPVCLLFAHKKHIAPHVRVFADFLVAQLKNALFVS